MSIKDTLDERQGSHGDFTINSQVSQHLKDTIKGQPGYDQLTNVQKEALDMICHKMARIIAGNPNWADHWHDIAGYAKLAEDRIDEEM